MLRFTKESITPSRAGQLLAATQAAGFLQRSVSKAYVTRYAAAMQRGLWDVDTGDTIKLGKKQGKEIVLDGQHRLSAIVAANAPIDLWVVRHVDVECFRHFDQGRARDVTDILTVSGWPDAKVHSNAGRMLWKEDTTGSPFIKPDDDESLGAGDIASYITENYRPALTDFYTPRAALFRKISKAKLGGTSPMVYLFFRLAQVDAQRCDDVLHYLADYATLSAPHRAWVAGVERAGKLRLEILGPSGRNTMGTNKDLGDGLVRVWRAAWDVEASGQRVTSKVIEREVKRMQDDEPNGWSTLGLPA
jgi:hypothetical protein